MRDLKLTPDEVPPPPKPTGAGAEQGAHPVAPAAPARPADPLEAAIRRQLEMQKARAELDLPTSIRVGTKVYKVTSKTLSQLARIKELILDLAVTWDEEKTEDGLAGVRFKSLLEAMESGQEEDALRALATEARFAMAASARRVGKARSDTVLEILAILLEPPPATGEAGPTVDEIRDGLTVEEMDKLITAFQLRDWLPYHAAEKKTLLAG